MEIFGNEDEGQKGNLGRCGKRSYLLYVFVEDDMLKAWLMGDAILYTVNVCCFNWLIKC